MRRLRRGFVLGLFTGAVGVVLSFCPVGRAAEELGLYLLFRLRGPVRPPAGVAIVSVDPGPDWEIGGGRRPQQIPRSVYARLVRRLTEEGVSLVAIDVSFHDSKGDQDEDLAQAMKASERVVLVQYLDRITLPFATGTRAVPPFALLAAEAVGIGPHVLPKVSRLSQFWTFLPLADGAPTLPAVSLQAHALPSFGRFMSLAKRAGLHPSQDLPRDAASVADAADLRNLMRVLRRRFTEDPRLSARFLRELRLEGGLSPDERRLFEALVELYAGPDSRYLNFYGPPGLIATIPYHRIVDGSSSGALNLRGKVVFVGRSEIDRAEQMDSYHTVYSTPDGVDLSGVEIAATAFANLATGSTVVPMPVWMAVGVLLAFAVFVSMVNAAFSEAGGALAALGLGVALLISALFLFLEHGLWIPLGIPLGVQLPLAVVLSLASRSRAAKQIIAYFLPLHVARQIEDGTAPGSATELVEGTFIATDAERYTTVSERMSPVALASLMNDYFAALAEPAVRRGGKVSEVTADSMMCSWTSPGADGTTRRGACLAAFEMAEAVDRFNAVREPDARLPTRFGLHSGQVVLGAVGALGHYSYQIVGDIANTASRIQGLAKHLETRILASEIVVSGLDELLSRRVGSFRLMGKAHSLTIHEILGLRSDASEEELDRCGAFAYALALFEERRLAEAEASFLALLAAHPTDGPARFYLGQCRKRLAAQQERNEGFIELDVK